MNKKLLITTLLLFLLFLIIWILYPFLLGIIFPKEESRGLFGDSYGGLNTLFSGFAFLGIIYTILLQQSQLTIQKEELELQRKELELTREELKRTAEAQEKSEQALSKQVEKMDLTAKLSALGALLGTYNDFAHREGGQSMKIRVEAQ